MKLIFKEYGRAVIAGILLSLLLFYLLFHLEADGQKGLLEIIGNFSVAGGEIRENSDLLIRKTIKKEEPLIVYIGDYLFTGVTYQLADYFIWKEESFMDQKPVISAVFAPDGSRMEAEQVREGVTFTQQGIYQVELYGVDDQNNRTAFEVRLPVIEAGRQVK